MPRNKNWPEKSFQEVVEIAANVFATVSERGYDVTPGDVESRARLLAERFYYGKDRRRGAARLVKALQPIAGQLNYRRRDRQAREELRMLQTLKAAGWRYLSRSGNPWGPGLWQHQASGVNVNRNGGVFNDIFQAAKATLNSATFQVLNEARPCAA